MGDLKEGIVKNNIVFPVTQLKLLEKQQKNGCCGPLSRNYYLFGFMQRGTRGEEGETGSFYVGSDCAKQFVKLINERRRRAGKRKGEPYRVLSLPPLFNPQSHARNIYPVNTYESNRELIDAIHLIATLWDTPIYGSLLYILTSMLRHPDRAVSDASTLFVNSVIGKDRKIVSGECANFYERLALEEQITGHFRFDELAMIVDRSDKASHNFFADSAYKG